MFAVFRPGLSEGLNLDIRRLPTNLAEVGPDRLEIREIECKRPAPRAVAVWYARLSERRKFFV